MDSAHVRWLVDLDATDVPIAGGKGAGLGAATRVAGTQVPPGFCVTTRAFRHVVLTSARVGRAIDRLDAVRRADGALLVARSAEVRDAVLACTVPADVDTAIAAALDALGPDVACAVRSSATTEDGASQSSAGLHDTYLGLRGRSAVTAHVLRCWASLFSDRAVAYRSRNGIEHRGAQMAVVVQRMVDARASGVLFTADPVSSNRRILVIDAVRGLGHELVAGRVRPDSFRVRDGVVVARDVAEPDREPSLGDDEVLRLAELGRRVETALGSPQDIEWCIDDDGVHVVQSRAITTLFPIPERDDRDPRVYVSVGHQQMMTDPMTPFGLSLWQMTALRPMHAAGGRLFVDVTDALASPPVRAGLLAMLGRSDPLIQDALETVVARGFVPERDVPVVAPPAGTGPPAEIATDRALVSELVDRTHETVAATRRAVGSSHGAAIVDTIAKDVGDLRRFLADPDSMRVISAGMDATWWLSERMREWLGDEHAADVLARSAPGNITSEMGLALLDVADVVRPFPEVVAFLRDAGSDDHLERLDHLAGGPQSRRAIEDFLDRFGMRCAGEIDIARPRWREQPGALFPVLLAHVDHFTAGEAARRFARGEQDARAAAADVLARLRALPDGDEKADAAARMIERVRAFVGYRELPKYGIVSRFLVYKVALLTEIRGLVSDGVLRAVDDAWFLTFDELGDAIVRRRADLGLVDERRLAHRAHAALVPPRVLTSEGEAFQGSYRRGPLPVGALVGLGVSAGVVEGRARVVLDPSDVRLAPGDVLVTVGTDPSWTPRFVTVAGLVTEVGGLTTHGSVIAREYGLPAVVGVHDATRRIRDGARLRVDGSSGVVEVLS